ncbi:MAG: hypothetical protein AAFO81_07005 [Pseudomonadota bacterium]
MRFRILAMCALLATATIAHTERISTVDAFVTSLGLGQNFYAISERTAQRTTTYQALISKVGRQQADTLIKQHLQAVVAQRQAQWDANLLTAYRAHFSDEQLLSIANEGAQSPHAALFDERRAAVSEDMQTMSADMLLQTVSDGLNRALMATTE